MRVAGHYASRSARSGAASASGSPALMAGRVPAGWTRFIACLLEGDAVAAITWFADTAVFRHFGLPRTLRS